MHWRRIIGGVLLVFGVGVLAGVIAATSQNDNLIFPAFVGGVVFTAGYLLWRR